MPSDLISGQTKNFSPVSFWGAQSGQPVYMINSNVNNLLQAQIQSGFCSLTEINGGLTQGSTNSGGLYQQTPVCILSGAFTIMAICDAVVPPVSGTNNWMIGSQFADGHITPFANGSESFRVNANNISTHRLVSGQRAIVVGRVAPSQPNSYMVGSLTSGFVERINTTTYVSGSRFGAVKIGGDTTGMQSPLLECAFWPGVYLSSGEVNGLYNYFLSNYSSGTPCASGGFPPSPHWFNWQSTNQLSASQTTIYPSEIAYRMGQAPNGVTSLTTASGLTYWNFDGVNDYIESKYGDRVFVSGNFANGWNIETIWESTQVGGGSVDKPFWTRESSQGAGSFNYSPVCSFLQESGISAYVSTPTAGVKYMLNSGNPNIANTAWHLINVSYDASAQRASIYQDGQEVAFTSGLTAVQESLNSGFFRLGVFQIGFGKGTGYMQGNYSYFTVSSGAKSLAQHQTDYTNFSNQYRSKFFHPQSGEQVFTVPSGVTKVTAYVGGAQGNWAYKSGQGSASALENKHAGGRGSLVITTINVTPGENLYCWAAPFGGASISGAGGITAGGPSFFASGAAYNGGAGGAYSAISTVSNTLNSGTILVVAGGGGGGGGTATVETVVGGQANITSGSPVGGNGQNSNGTYGRVWGIGALQSGTAAGAAGIPYDVNDIRNPSSGGILTGGLGGAGVTRNQGGGGGNGMYGGGGGAAGGAAVAGGGAGSSYISTASGYITAGATFVPSYVGRGGFVQFEW